MKRAWITFWTTLILVLPIRIYAVLRYLDPETGFYSDSNRMVGIASLLLFVGIIVTAYFASRNAVSEIGTEPLKNVTTAVLGAFAGVFVIVQSIVGLGTEFLEVGQIFYKIFSVTGILAGAVLMLIAYDFATGSRIVGNRPFLALVPSVWGCFFLVILFITYSAIVNLPENVYHTFTVVFLLLFLFTQAKLLTGIESTKSGKMIYMVGFPAALLALMTGVPSCIQFFSAGKTAGIVSIGMHMANIILAFYILAFLYALQSVFPTEKGKAPDESAPSHDIHLQKEAAENAESNVNEEENLIAEYAGFLSEVCGSGRTFSAIRPSPFYSKEGSTAGRG
ncbi:MAG: YndJ-like protein [Oscillospiraceae bacterium]|jgi:hypothetical protein